jgi:hypothetical protein
MAVQDRTHDPAGTTASGKADVVRLSINLAPDVAAVGAIYRWPVR